MPLFELPVENSEHPNFEYRAVNIFVLRSIPFEDNLSTFLTPIIVQMEKKQVCIAIWIKFNTYGLKIKLQFHFAFYLLFSEGLRTCTAIAIDCERKPRKTATSVKYRIRTQGSHAP